MAGPEERLRRYRSKRDFTVTDEPAGVAEAPGSARFVIQEHHARRLHWDLRLERDGVLASWALPKGLPEAPGSNHFAARTEDHPLQYIDFHGEIPTGQYGAGTMKIWDHGTYETLKWEARKVEVALHGERLDARYALFAIGKEDDPKDWMIHRMDPPADPGREPMPASLRPMRAVPGPLPAGPDWSFEFHWPGERAIAYSEPGVLRLEGTEDLTGRYPELGRLGRALGSRSAVLDGVVVAFDADGRPSGSVLARRAAAAPGAQVRRLAAELPVTYVIFDLLWLDGHPLTALPYADRRDRLAGLRLDGERWRTPVHVVGNGAAVLEASAAHGLPGIVAKRVDSAYEAGRESAAWIAAGDTNRDVRLELDGRPVRLAELGEALCPGADRMVLDYYARIAPVIFTHLRGRSLTARPAGDAPRQLHAGLGLAASPDRPTAVMFDLDPGAPATIVDCCAVALRMHGMFEHLGLACCAKTSGSGGGLQVHVPLGEGEPTFAQTRAFGRMVAELLARDEPELVVAGEAPAAGRVRVDSRANDRQRTTVAVYSLRADLAVSTPVAWDEVRRALDAGDPAELRFGPEQVLDRVDEVGDLFAPMISLRQPLPGA